MVLWIILVRKLYHRSQRNSQAISSICSHAISANIRHHFCTCSITRIGSQKKLYPKVDSKKHTITNLEALLLSFLTWMLRIAWCIPINTFHSFDSSGRADTTSNCASVAFFINLVLIRCQRPRFHSVCCSWTARHVFHTSRKHSRSERSLQNK